MSVSSKIPSTCLTGKPDLSTDPQNRNDTLIQAFCGRLIEACWLVAAGVLPLLLDPVALDGFHPIKMSVLNTLGLITMAALAVRVAHQGWRTCEDIPAWLVAALVLLTSTVASTVWSVSVENSLWGVKPFLQGCFGLFCQLALFAGVATCLRSREQCDRLIAVILAMSLPISLFMIYQRSGWDPLAYQDTAPMAKSFAGHPTFAAGTLLFALPLCAWKCLQALAHARASKRWKTILPVVFFGIILLTQLAALLASGKRGPFLGMLAAAASAAILHALVRQRTRQAVFAITLSIGAVLCLAGLAYYGRMNPEVRKIPVINRLSMIVPVGAGTSDVFRKMVWENAPAITLDTEAKSFPDGETDKWWMVRPLLGYGQETLQVFLPQHVFLVGVARPDDAVECRFHNSFWDGLQSTGFVGLLASFWLGALVFSRGLSVLRLNGAVSKPWPLFASGVLSGCGTGLAFELAFGKGYFGLGFPVGFTGGLLLWPLALTWRSHASPQEGGTFEQALAIVLLSALVAHWVDMAFIYPTANTSALWWVGAGVLPALARPGGLADGIATLPEKITDPPGWFRTGLGHGLLAGGATVAVTNAFITYYFTDARTTGAVLEASLTRMLLNRGPSHLIPMLVLPSLVVANLIPAFICRQAAQKGGILKSLAVSFALSLALAISWSIYKAGKLAIYGPLPDPSTSAGEIIRRAMALEDLALFFFLLIVLLPFLLALVSGIGRRLPHRPVGMRFLPVAVVGTALVGTAVWNIQVPLLRGEASANLARVHNDMGHSTAVVALYQRSADHAPRDVNNRIGGARALMTVAERSTDIEECLRIMREAANFLENGLSHDRRNVLNHHHGNVLMRLAFETPPGDDKMSPAHRARAAYSAALIYAPNTEITWFESSILDKHLLGDAKAAETGLARAAEIAETADPSLFGDYYSYLMQTTANPVLNQAYGARAAWYYRRALDRSGDLAPEERARLLLARGTVLVNLRQPPEAIDCLLEVTRLGEVSELWRVHAMLAELHLSTGDLKSAGDHVEEAIRRAPEEQLPQLRQLKAHLIR